MVHFLRSITSRDLAAGALGLSLTCLLGSGLDNVAHAFAEVKMGSSPLVHWGGAVAVELGVVALGLTIAVRAQSGRRPLILYGGVLLFVAASIFANYDASLESLTSQQMRWSVVSQLDPWTLAKALLLGGAIPLMVLLVIEALRELALDFAANRRPVLEVAEQRTVMQVALDGGRWSGALPSPVGDGQLDLDDGERGTPERMRELTATEPAISAVELADRLKVARATVYRWRDELGLVRVEGRWTIP